MMEIWFRSILRDNLFTKSLFSQRRYFHQQTKQQQSNKIHHVSGPITDPNSIDLLQMSPVRVR